MTKQHIIIREQMNLQKEIQKIKRHNDFLTTMQLYGAEDDNKIDWEAFWSWYYHSTCTADQAFAYINE